MTHNVPGLLFGNFTQEPVQHIVGDRLNLLPRRILRFVVHRTQHLDPTVGRENGFRSVDAASMTREVQYYRGLPMVRNVGIVA